MEKRHEEEVSSLADEAEQTAHGNVEPKEDGAAAKETAAEEAHKDAPDAEDKPGQHVEAETSDMSKAVIGGVHRGKFHRLLGFFGRHKVWSAVCGVVVVVAVLAAVPWTRYKIAGLFLKQTVTVAVVDSQTNAPVTSADVTLAGVSAKTDNHGDAKLHVRVGSSKVTVTKAYYQTKTFSTVVPILKPKHVVSASFISTGRQVPIVVLNKITGKPLENAEVKAASSEAKTNAKGQAIVVLPPNKATVAATISASGYNDAATTVQITTQAVAANTFSLTPSGKLYFLSNLSGKIDVVKTNLDGSARQTVLAGTGYEDPNNTSLLASRDWKYLALESVRTAGSNASAQLNLIDTTNGDKVTNIDEGANVNFTLAGWDGDDFIYTVQRTNIPDWQSGKEAIKSFDATTGKITVLDQTTATNGDSELDYVSQQFGTVNIIGDHLVYATNWQVGYNVPVLIYPKQAQLISVKPDGTGRTVIHSFMRATGMPESYSLAIETEQYEPNALYVYFNDAHNDFFYTYEDGALKPNTTLTQLSFYNNTYPTYLFSPSGNQTFWSVSADGKNNLLVGDDEGDNGKQIATLSDYDIYGWYTDNYLLVSKNSSELYIMPVAGGTPLKISDYYKPAQSFYGYGKGYGGL
ncbi:MAG TPA: hypothetical protein VIM53_04740 [Candidatus Saccharimonadales bacterium]